MNQDNQLHQIIQDIQTVIESKTINGEQKENKIREIYNELKKKDKYKLETIFNIDGFKQIQSYINDCTTGIEKILLDIIELVAEKGIQTYIFNNFVQSGFMIKIQQIIKDKIDEEKKEMIYSVVVQQLIRIYIQLMKKRDSNQQMIDICVKVINKNINNLLNTINKLKEENNKGNKNEQETKETESELISSAQLIKVISFIGDKERKIPGQIMQIIKERISSLVHLNCPPDISCQQCINVPQYHDIIELKSAVFQSLSEVSWNNKEYKEILVNDHNIILHLTQPFIKFAFQSQFDKKTNSQEQYDQQIQEQSSSISLIASSLKSLDRIITNNNTCKQMINNPKALHSLTTLSIYKINIHFNQEYDLQTLALRSGSRKCLFCIQEYGDVYAHTDLVNANYARILVIAISTAGGLGEEQDGEISSGLFRISYFLRCLNQGKYNSFPPLPLLAQISKEQIEEEGGSEEIESQLINKGYNYINVKANQAKAAILNYFIDINNTRPEWYRYR